jgi:tRNA-dependent cyclodipeptide synthase
MSGSETMQYPAPTGRYRVSLKNRTAWQGSVHVRLQISVGKPGTEGEKFYALCEWAAARFPMVVLVVSDSLQRHNLMFEHGLSAAAAHAQSVAEGDAWLVRNRVALGLLNQPQVLRWDAALAHPETTVARRSLEALIHASPEFGRALDATIAAFWQRHAGQNATYTPFRRDAFARHSRDFLLEELAVFSWLCRADGVDAYAGSWLAPLFGVLAAGAGPLAPAFAKDWLQIDYVRNGAALAMAA